MIRYFILPAPALVLFGIVSGVVVLAEWGISSEAHGKRVILSDAYCVGAGVKAETSLFLALDCGPKYPATTTTPATIKQYVANSATKFRCELHQNGSADCTPITAKK